ncbi:MAG: hypothetical protein JXA03_07255 [Bacteroidales bacterium]|nr:hypothetical protein [Bacteroidales bacterium]
MRIVFLILAIQVFTFQLLIAQTPQSFKYQSVLRDNTGELLQNQLVGIRISIHTGTSGGTVVYRETFSNTTNQFGLLSLEIGTGTPVTGTFPGINWHNGSKFIEIEIDDAGGTNYISIGTTQLLSVPYALYAGEDGDWTVDGGNIHSSVSGNVGIGLSNPSEKLEVAGNISITPVTGGRLKIGRSGYGGGEEQHAVIEATAFSGWTSGMMLNVWNGNSYINGLTIDYTGEVGIGTTNPLSKLHVVGSSGTAIHAESNTTYAIVGESGGSYYAGVQGRAKNANAIGLYAHNQYGGTALRAYSSGGLAGYFEGNVTIDDNLGIGILNPLNCRIQVAGSGTYDGFVRLANIATGGADFFMGATNDNWSAGGGKFLMGHGAPSSGNVDLTIDVTGKVGIGTTSPQNLLEVNGTTLIGTAAKGLRMRNTGAVVDIESLGASLALNYQTGFNTIMNVVSGNVGIGTASPNYKLEVYAAGNSYSISGRSDNSIGVHGFSNTNVAVYAQSASGTGLFGQSSTGNAGYFSGNVHITGSLSKGGGSFLIDHPSDPENKLLRHNFVESPENLLIYRGKVQLDHTGTGHVVLPDYFADLTDEENASIHTTPVGRPFISGCEWEKGYVSFMVYGEPNRSVFWEVLADRDDPVIHEIGRPVEEMKGTGNPYCDKGQFLYPKAYGYPESLGKDFQMLKILHNK